MIDSESTLDNSSFKDSLRDSVEVVLLSVFVISSTAGGGGFSQSHPIKISPMRKNPINELISTLLSSIFYFLFFLVAFIKDTNNG